MDRRSLRRIPSNERIKDLKEIRRNNTQFDFKSFDLEHTDKKEDTNDGSTHSKKKIITARKLQEYYVDAEVSSKAAKDNNPCNVLQPTQLKDVRAQFTEIFDTLTSCSKACLEAGNMVDTREQEHETNIRERNIGEIKSSHENLTDAFEHRIGAYKDLAGAILAYHRAMEILKDKLKRKLRVLAPKGVKENPPELYSHSIQQDIKKFIQNNIREIVLNKSIDHEYKIGIIDTIEMPEDKTIAPDLLAKLPDSKSHDNNTSNLCIAIYKTLEKTGDKTTVQSLFNRLSDLRWAYNGELELAFHTIAAIDGEAAAPHLVAYLEAQFSRDSFPTGIYKTLGKIGNKATAQFLIKRLSHCSDEARTATVDAVIEIAGRHTFDKEMLDGLVTRFGDESTHEDERKAIGKILTKVGNDTTAQSFIPWLDKSSWTALQVVDTLGDMGHGEVLSKEIRKEILQALEQRLLDQNTHPRMRIAFYGALGKLGDETTAQFLLTHLKDPDAYSHKLYARYTWSYRHIQVLDDFETKVASAIGDTGAGTIAPELVPLLAKEGLKQETGSAIVDALEKLNNRAVEKQLEDIYPQVNDEGIRLKIAVLLDKWSWDGGLDWKYDTDADSGSDQGDDAGSPMNM